MAYMKSHSFGWEVKRKGEAKPTKVKTKREAVKLDKAKPVAKKKGK